MSILEREEFEVSEDVLKLVKILSEALNVKIFGFDLIRPIKQDKYYLIDLNDFPSFKGIPNIENKLCNFIYKYIKLI